MPFSRPTLTQLRNQAMQDITASNIGADGFLRFAVVRVLAWVQAAMAYLHYGYIDYIALQSNPWTATDEFAAGWGALVGVFQEDASFSSGPITFTGSAGVTIPNLTSITRSDGAVFTSTAPVTVAPGATTVNVPVTANVAGEAGDSVPGTSFKLSSPIAGIVGSSGVAAAPGLTGGADQEAFSSFKSRYLAEYAAPPQGGDRSDFIEWARAVPGVTRAWVAPNMPGPGNVTVYTMFDETEANFDGFPQGTNGVATNEPRAIAATGDQLTVANSILPVQPVTALVYSCAPVNAPVPFTIANLGMQNTEAMQSSIESALAAMFVTEANVGGTINPATGQPWPPIDPSAWFEALASIPGLTNFSVPSPASPMTPTTGQLFTLGVVTFES
jgi:uncharacterized phage protein gp47/JayE